VASVILKSSTFGACEVDLPKSEKSMSSRYAPCRAILGVIVSGWGGIALAGAPVSQTDLAPAGGGSTITFPLAGADMEQRLHDLSPFQRAQAIQETEKPIRALSLACKPTDAERIGHGKYNVDGKRLEVVAYEVACSNGMGYLLASLGAEKPIAVSCFAAAATRADGIARGEKSDVYCQLAANKDLKAMAASLMTAAGTSCTVNDLRWFGLAAATHTEYTEVDCGDGNGYLLKAQQYEPAAQVSAVSCREAAKQGLKCHLTDGGPVAAPVTMQTFRDALKEAGVSCEPTQMRLVGRETVSKRYVVEMQCPDMSDLVAFIPLQDTTKKFETLDCAAAMERNILCTLKSK
jgi:hypothetical protein